MIRFFRPLPAALVACVVTSAARPDSAPTTVRAALDAMGGVSVVRSITSVQISGAGYALGDTVDGGPPAVAVFAFTETRNNARPQLVQDVSMVTRPDVVHRTVTTRTAPRVSDAWFTEAPENVLLAALDAPDLASDGDGAVRFTWKGRPVRVRFAAGSSLPVAMTLGDATTIYSRWHRESHGISYPHQWDVQQNGVAVEAFSVEQVVIEVQGP